MLQKIIFCAILRVRTMVYDRKCLFHSKLRQNTSLMLMQLTSIRYILLESAGKLLAYR